LIVSTRVERRKLYIKIQSFKHERMDWGSRKERHHQSEYIILNEIGQETFAIEKTHHEFWNIAKFVLELWLN